MKDAETLYRRIADLAPSSDPEAAIAIGESHWGEIAAREPNAHDAETCRLLCLAAIEQAPPDFPLANLWRDRALELFTQTGWHEGVGTLLMGKAFAALSEANDDYVHGRTLDVIRGSQEALDLMDGILPLLDREPSGVTVGPRSPSKALLTRFYYEKRGFLLLALGELGQAAESYGRAAESARGEARGTVKVRLGRALVQYEAGARDAALAETIDAADAARELGDKDLIETGERNREVMETGGANLTPYEIL